MARRERKAIPDSVRFEVFKRDQFKCQYCGRCAPEVVLNADHIEPHSKGGADEVINLITSCRDCNSGKGDRRLSDDSVVAKQRAQLEELEERRQQLEMMMKWRSGLADLGDAEVDAFGAEYSRCVPGWSINETGRLEVRRLIGKFGLRRCLDAIGRAAGQYVTELVDGKATADASRRTWRSIWVFAQPEDMQAIYFVRAVVRNKLTDIGRWTPARNWQSLAIIKRTVAAGVPIEDIREATFTRAQAGGYFSFDQWETELDSMAEAMD